MYNENYSINTIEVSDKTGKITCGLGLDDCLPTSHYSGHLVQQAGICAMPPKPKDKDFCSAVILENNSGNPTIIATYDERRQDVAKLLQPGEVAIYSIGDGTNTTIITVQKDTIDIKYNDSSMVQIKDGKVIVTTDKLYVGDANASKELALKSDVESVVSTLNSLILAYNKHMNGAYALVPDEAKSLQAKQPVGTQHIVVSS